MSKQHNDTEATTHPAKRKRNRPDLANFGAEYAEPGDNARYLRYARVSLSLPPIDISDPRQVEQRINEYFDFCEQNDRKPSMLGIANWLGVSRDTLNSWKRGECRADTHSDLVKKTLGMLEEILVDYFQNGKVNPTSGIFLLKNMFGYRDVTEHVVTPPSPLQVDSNPEDIASKYAELPED